MVLGVVALQEQRGLVPGRQPELVQSLRQMCVGSEQGRGTGHSVLGAAWESLPGSPGTLGWESSGWVSSEQDLADAGEGPCAGPAGRDGAELG